MSFNRLEASGTSESTSNSSSLTPNRRTPIWEYYEPELVHIDGVLKAICKYRGTKLTVERKSGTNSLQTHIAEYCPKVTSDDRNKFVATMKKKSDGSFTFDKKRSRDLMIDWVIRADVAFNKFDDEGFEPWMESMQPTLNCIGRQTIQNECVAKFDRAKAELRSELQNLNSRICFTSDLWTSNQKLGYICVTAHYIGTDFILKKKIIAFKDVKYPHTGVAIEEALSTVLNDYGIKEKVLTITLNNAANNKAACDLLIDSGKRDMFFGGEHLLVRCCAHILNILVQDGMSIATFVIETLRDLIRHINSSPSRMQDFNEIAQREDLLAKAGLVLDVPNHWNSTHAMIVDAIKYKIVLRKYAIANQQPFPTEDEIGKVESIGEFHGVFEETSRAFSVDRYPTSHIFLDNVLCVHQTLRSPEWHKNQLIADLANAMDKKFDKYWDGTYNICLVICTILDPRTKVDLLDFFYEKVCKNFIDIDISKNLAKEWLHKYFRKYEEVLRRNGTYVESQTAPSSRSMVPHSPVLRLGKRRLRQEFDQYRNQRRGTWIEKTELEAYLEEPPVREDESVEILTWWKTNSNKYPVLSAMARDFLAIPLSTVSSESAFSLSGQILSDNRSSMTPRTLEALVCCKDWFYKYATNEAQEEVRQL